VEATIRATDGEFDVVFLSDGTINAPLGTRGGMAGAPARQAVQRGAGPVEELGVAGRLTLYQGDAIISRCCGGGGYGDPEQREVERVLADVAEGVISRDRARDVYGVEVDEREGRA
jgi:N-methylhydantoinase B